jgi:exopolysaccharide production protein ExoY
MQNISIFKWESLEKNILIKHNGVKRLFDIFFSLLVLILGSPMYLIIGLLVYISSPGPIFYGHERIGRGNKKIKCWKFRTMIKDADKNLESLLNENPNLKLEWNKFYKLKNDPRIHPVGKFLRKSSLDELPQFYNVLKGDLSVVGPRPCVEGEIKENFGDKTSKILSIRPGITGIWQISGRNNLTREQRVAIEESYIKNQSLLLDIKIILKTLPIMLFSKGAY